MGEVRRGEDLEGIQGQMQGEMQEKIQGVPGAERSADKKALFLGQQVSFSNCLKFYPLQRHFDPPLGGCGTERRFVCHKCSGAWCACVRPVLLTRI